MEKESGESSEQNSYNSQEYEINSDDSENFRQILVIQKELRNQKMSRKGQKIPEEIAGLMGEANQHFINSNFDHAIQKLYEIIRKYPNFPEPFNLLGLISEEKQEPRKSAHFFRLAAEMSHDKDLWEKIGYMYKNMEDYEQASICFGRALKSDPLNSQLIRERADCCEKYGDFKKSAVFYEKLTNMIDNKELVKKTAKMYTKAKYYEHAIRVLKKNLSKDDVISIHMIVELYLVDQQYQQCQQFMEHYFQKNDYKELPQKILYQYLVCLVNQKQKQKMKEHIEIITSNQIEFSFENFMKIASLLEQYQEYEQSREVLESMMDKEIQHHQLRCLYSSLGRVYQNLDDDESAIDVYLAVLKLDEVGFDMESRMALSDLYKKQGKIKKALQILKDENMNDHKKQQLDIFESEELVLNDQPEHYRMADDIQMYQVLEKCSKKTRKGENKVSYRNAVNVVENKQETVQEFELEINRQVEQLNNEINLQNQKMILQKGGLLLEEDRELDYIGNSFETIILILNQEYMIQLLKEKIMNIYYNQMEIKRPLKEQWNLIRNKKQKQKVYLQKKRKKQGEKKMNEYIEKLNYYSKVEGIDRLVNEVKQARSILLKYKKYSYIQQLVISVTRLNDIEVSDKKLFLLEGLQSSIRSQNYEMGFHLIKKLIKMYKNEQSSKYLIMVLAHIIRNMKDVKLSRSFILKMAKRDYSDIEIQKLWVHMLGNSYLQSGNFDLSIKMYYSLYKNQPSALVALQLASGYLQESLRRTQTEKQKNLMRCMYFMQLYKKWRLEEGDYKNEVYYNQGRMFSQVGFWENAIECFKCSMECDDRNLHNKSVYNLIVIYKKLGESELALKMVDSYI